MPAESQKIHVDNREILAELRLIGEALRQMSHDIHNLWKTVEVLGRMAERHAPIVDAYQRGGILAARTARKAAANGR